MSALTEVTAPANEPITLVQARDHLRLTATGSPATHADDTYVTALIAAARRWCEGFTQRAIITQTWDWFLDGFEDGDGADKGILEVPKPPLISVTTIKYLDSAGSQQTWASSKYRVDSDSQPGRISPAFGEAYPAVRGVMGDVEVRLVAGYGADDTAVVDDLLQAMKIVMAHWYEHREPIITGTIVASVPMSAEYLARPHQVVRF